MRKTVLGAQGNTGRSGGQPYSGAAGGAAGGDEAGDEEDAEQLAVDGADCHHGLSFMAEFEIFGADVCANSDEQSVGRRSTTTSRRATPRCFTSTQRPPRRSMPRLRSPYAGNSSYFAMQNTSGTAGYTSASYSCGVGPRLLRVIGRSPARKDLIPGGSRGRKEKEPK